MLIAIQNIKFVYQHILQSALDQDGNGCTIYIFVSNDVDSISSLKILTVSIFANFLVFEVNNVFWV